MVPAARHQQGPASATEASFLHPVSKSSLPFQLTCALWLGLCFSLGCRGGRSPWWEGGVVSVCLAQIAARSRLLRPCAPHCGRHAWEVLAGLAHPCGQCSQGLPWARNLGQLPGLVFEGKQNPVLGCHCGVSPKAGIGAPCPH